MLREVGNAVSVAHSVMRFGLVRAFRGDAMKSGLIERFSPDVAFELDRGGCATIGDRVRAHSGCKFKIRDGGQLVLGNDVSFNYGCIVVCRHRIEIGEGTEFGPSVYIYDHDHDYRAGLKRGTYRASPIIIGKNCWIGANTIILRGTRIGDNSVIGAGSLVSGIIPENSVMVQKREKCIISIDSDGYKEAVKST